KTGTDQTAISAADAAIKNFQSRPELYIFQAFNDKPELFAAIPNFAEKMDSFDPIIFGGMFNLCDLPTWTFPALLIPIFAGLTQLAYTVYMQWYQKKQNPDAPSMGAMNLVMYLMPLMSIWMAFAFPMGVGFYWIIQSIVAFGQTVLLKKYYSKDRLEKILAKDRAKQKKKKPSFMQRALEEQKRMMAENGGQMPVSARDAVSKDVDVEKLSKSGKKELDRKIIAEARRRQAEKYGEEYVDTDDEKE
ncbi:MAG: YidC/Oxa1 family membrane protein insertase, partial [Oscillospiraceae bacterium]